MDSQEEVHALNILCCICWENLAQDGRKTVRLPLKDCRHAFCEACISQFFRTQIEDEKIVDFRCPMVVGELACLN